MRFLFVIAALIFAALPAYAAFDSADSSTIKTLEILRITPDGEDVPAGKQIVVTFNRPVVPLGRMERTAAEIPITISPALECEWRWINTSALACNLPDKGPLREATKYTMDIKPGIKTEDGVTLAAATQHVFITQRPDYSYTEFRQWKAQGLPVVRLVFNQPVEKESVAKHVFLEVGENKKRVSLKVSRDEQDRELPQFLPVPGESYAMMFEKQAKQKSDDDVRKTGKGESRRIWIVEPEDEQPGDTHISVRTEPGLISALGAETSVNDAEIVQFDTFPEFEFLGVNCTDNFNKPVVVLAGQDPVGKCNPMQSVNLSFSVPVDREKMGNMLTFSPIIGGWKKTAQEAEQDEVSAGGDGEGEGEVDPSAEPAVPQIGWAYRVQHNKGKTYEVWLPGGLKAAQVYTLTSHSSNMGWFARQWHHVKSWFGNPDPIDAQDVFGRELKNSISAKFATDHRLPNYVLDYSDAVIEKGVDSEIPLYVNNIESYDFSYRGVSSKSEQDNGKYHKVVPKVQDIQFAVPLGLREMLGGKSGAVFGYLRTTPEVNSNPQSLFAQVTPYQVHLKLGHFNTLAWVTDMKIGAPVAGAKVSIYQDSFTSIHNQKTNDGQATTDVNGIAMLPGTDKLDPDLSITRAYDEGATRYFIRVDKGDDMALLPISYSFQINSYRSSGSESVYPSNKYRYGHMRAWGTTAQGVYRAGDTIQYKIFVRNQDNNGFIPPPAAGYSLKIVDPTGKVVHKVNKISLSKFGGVSGEFKIPKEGAVGWYDFKITANFAAKSGDDFQDAVAEMDDSSADGRDNEEDDYGPATSKKSFTPMRVLVSDFTPAAFKVSNQLNGDLFHATQDVNVTTHAELHSGGAYTDAAARITAMLDSSPFTSKNSAGRNFQFDSYKDENPSQQLFQKIDKVGDKGELALSFSTGAPKIVYGKITVESAVADDRGKYISSVATADFAGVDRLVGLHSNAWLYEVGKEAALEYVVVDEKGNPVKGTDVEITLTHETSKAARVKGAGNAYLSEYTTVWEPAGECKGTSDIAPLTCKFTPAKAGTYRAVAKIKDTKGREHSTTYSAYTTGNDYVVWNDENDTSLTIIPESTSYKVGDTARYLVKNPYPGAKALISIERYGVMDKFVQTFDSSTPIVEVKIKPDYLPGFYMSVVIVSPRVEKPLGEGKVDLGKPAFRMGYVTVPVKDPYKEMVITSKTDREVYKPRDKVTVKIHAEPRVKDKKEPIELTVAVLDEAVFDLITGGKAYFDPYDGFYKLESLDLRNYSLLTRLVGRQKFEKKGANPGGDGGSDLSMRSIFKFVSYWNAELKTDKDGNATASFDAPDNLTGWRVLAIATTPTDRFGLGDANFKVNRPTEVRPVMPNQVMEGDNFDAGFSVMNRTDKARTLNVKIHVDGNVDAAKSPDLVKSVTLEPYKRITVYMPIKATPVVQVRDVMAGNLHFTVTAGDKDDKDGMVHDVPVNKRRAFDVAANYGTTTKDKVEEPILFPKGILTDVGTISVVASPTVIGNVAGAFAYMRDYPYLCWEQKLSKGVMASHYVNLKSYLPDSLVWSGSNELPQNTLDQAAMFQAPNGGMTYFRAQDIYVDPYLSAYTAVAFNWMRKSGYKIPEAVESKLHAYLSNFLKNDVAPDFYSEGMSSTVRAVALDALAENGKADLADLERYQPHVKKMSLFGKTYFLQASLAIKGGEKYAPEVAKMILAMSNETGGKFVFNEQWDDSYSRILASPLRENCAVLDAFVNFGERENGKNLVGDVPFKLVRAITQDRKNRDHWENTQENMFCMNALIDYARVYEKDKPNMVVKTTMDNNVFGNATFKDVRDPAALMETPIKDGDAGRHTSVSIERSGVGRLYYATRLSYALPPEMSKPANAGIEVRREYSVERNGKWEMLKSPALVKRGELVRVDLYLSVPAARNFIVVDDPVPGGLEPVNRDLATTSVVDAKKGDFKASEGSFWFKYSDWIDFGVSRWSFYHQELRHDSARFYSDYLPPGNYHLSYAAQAIATGTFSALPTMAQEMYDPDVYGKTDSVSLKVSEQEVKAAVKP